jgi:hypothetical protein
MRLMFCGKYTIILIVFGDTFVSVCVTTGNLIYVTLLPRGHAVAQLAEALRYKTERRVFDSRWCHRKFSLTSFRPHYGPGVDPASNGHEYQEYFLWGKGGRWVGLPPSCADCLEIWEPSGPVQGLFDIFL